MKQKKQPKVKYRKCTQCDKKFSTDFCFNLHSNVHKSRKNAWFSCHACDRKFSQVAKLLGHRAIHPPPKLKVKKRKKNRKKDKNEKIKKPQDGKDISKNDGIEFESVGVEIKKEEIEAIEEQSDAVNFQRTCDVDENIGHDNVFAKFGLIVLDDDDVKSDLQVDVISSSNLNQSSASEHASVDKKEDNSQLILSNENAYYCNDCSMSFTREVAWHKHLELNHMGPQLDNTSEAKGIHPNQCGICGKMFSSKTKAHVHQKDVHSKTKPYKCQLCHFATRHKSSLQRHERMCKKTSKKTAVNEIASKDESALKGKQGLTKNSDVMVGDEVKIIKEKHPSHTGTGSEEIKKKNTVVDYLNTLILYNEGYGANFKLEDVMDVHGPRKGNHCCRFCGNTFGYKSSLKFHLRKHTNEKPYQCKVCLKSFQERQECKKHVQDHILTEQINNGKDSSYDVSLSGVQENRSNSQKTKTVRSKMHATPRVRTSKKTKPANSPEKESHTYTENLSNEETKAEETLSESEVLKILGEEDALYRKTRKKHLSYFDGADFSGDDDGNLSSASKPRTSIAKKKSRKRHKSESDSSSEEETRVPKQSKTRKNKLVMMSLGLIKSSDDESASVDETSRSDTLDSNKKKVSSHKRSNLKRSSSENSPKRKAPMIKIPDDNTDSSEDEKGPAFVNHSSKQSLNINDSDSESESDSYSNNKVSKTRRSVRSHMRKPNQISEEINMKKEESKSEFTKEGINSNKTLTFSADQPYKCKTCKMTYAEEFLLRKHQNVTGHSDVIYECSYCNEVYMSLGGLQDHVETHKPKENMVCNICNKQLQGLKSYKLHQKRHRDKPIKCELCSDLFATQQELEGHNKKSHDARKKFNCEICFKTFNCNGNLCRHVNTHTKAMRYSCDLCHTSYNQASNLTRHKRIRHKGEVSECLSSKSKNASDNFVHNQSYNRQKLIPQKLKTEETEKVLEKQQNFDCGLVSCSASTGDRHSHQKPKMEEADQSSHKPEDSSNLSTGKQCRVCDKVCKNSRSLFFHGLYVHRQSSEINIHNALVHYIINKETYICQLCGSTLSVRHSLIRHMRSKHSIDVSDYDVIAVPYEEAPSNVTLASSNQAREDQISSENIQKIFRNEVNNSKQYSKRNSSNPAVRSKDSISMKQSRSIRRNPDNKRQYNTNIKEVTSVPKSIEKSHLVSGNIPECDDVKPEVNAKCSLCGRKFDMKDKLKKHLNMFHKIPEGVEDALMALTPILPDAGSLKPDDTKDDVMCGESEDVKPHKPVHKVNGRYSDRRREVKVTRESAAKNKRSLSSVKDEGLCCPICNEHFKNIQLLEDHAAMCDDFSQKSIGTKAKKQCNVKPKSEKNLADGTKRIPKYNCDICNIDFYHFHALNNHKLFSPAHAKIGFLKCPSCRQTMKAKDFEYHSCTVGFIRCKICDVCFSSNTSLKRHIACVHSDQRQFSCESCGKSYNRKSILESHRCIVPKQE